MIYELQHNLERFYNPVSTSLETHRDFFFTKTEHPRRHELYIYFPEPKTCWGYCLKELEKISSELRPDRAGLPGDMVLPGDAPGDVGLPGDAGLSGDAGLPRDAELPGDAGLPGDAPGDAGLPGGGCWYEKELGVDLCRAPLLPLWRLLFEEMAFPH